MTQPSMDVAARIEPEWSKAITASGRGARNRSPNGWVARAGEAGGQPPHPPLGHVLPAGGGDGGRLRLAGSTWRREGAFAGGPRGKGPG